MLLYYDTSSHSFAVITERCFLIDACLVAVLFQLTRSNIRSCFLSLQKLAAECQSAGYSGTLIPYKCDLCNEDEILSMFSAIKTLHQGVDVCINNAGLAHNEPLLSGHTEGWRNMIDVSHTRHHL